VTECPQTKGKNEFGSTKPEKTKERERKEKRNNQLQTSEKGGKKRETEKSKILTKKKIGGDSAQFYRKKGGTEPLQTTQVSTQNRRKTKKQIGSRGRSVGEETRWRPVVPLGD